VRRLLVIGAATMAMVVVFAVGRKNRGATVAAAGGSSGLTITAPPAPSGCALGPAFTFCDQTAGGTSATRRFTLTATSAANTLTFSILAIPGLDAQYDPADFTIAGTDCPTALAAGSSCHIDVAFAPTATGLREAALTASDPTAGATSINIAGAGANLAWAPPSPPSGCSQDDAFHQQDNAFTYCNEPVGGASGAETFALTAGNAATGLNLALAAVPGLSAEFNAADFTIESTTCTGTLTAGQSCTADVAFTPATAGLRSAALRATSSSGDSTTIYLAGHTNTGLELVPPSSACPALGNLFQYCNEPSGGKAAAVAFTLSNTSGAQVTGVSVPTSSPAQDFNLVNTNCPTTLAANATCTINVEFAPQKAGLRQGTLTVTDTEGDIGAANFAGVGDDYNLALESGQTQEMSVVAGGTITFKAQVAPDSVFGVNGEQVAFVCPTNLPANTSCTITPCPATVTAATPAAFQIVLTTSSATSVAPAPPQSTGCASYGFAELSPTSLRGPEFPSQPAPAWRALMAVVLALACALGALAWAGAGRRRRVRLALIATGLALVVLPSCHHKSAKVTSATPAGVTSMTIQGAALDANGNPLGASRSMKIILDVTAK
jgi:hypothetical protein